MATTLLRNEFPDVDVRWTSVACGGASIVQTGKFGGDPPPNKGGILTPYDGAEKLGKRRISADSSVPKVYPPQITQINTAFNGRIDALLMNLGGNDAGFAEHPAVPEHRRLRRLPHERRPQRLRRRRSSAS